MTTEMLSTRKQLEALNREFSSATSTMRPETFAARHQEIMLRAPTQDEAARAADEAADEDARFVTFGALKRMALKIAAGMSDHVSPLRSRVAALESRINSIEKANAAAEPIDNAAIMQQLLKLSIDEQRRIVETLYLPVVPTRYDKDGRLIEARRLDPGAATNESLERRLSLHGERLAQFEAQFEARPTLRYRGIWTEGEEYRGGDFVTDRGSVFHCNESGTKARPGDGTAWQLAVKRGRDR